MDFVSLLLGTLLALSAVPWSTDKGGLSTPDDEIGVLSDEPLGLQTALELSSSSSSTSSSSFLLSYVRSSASSSSSLPSFVKSFSFDISIYASSSSFSHSSSFS